MLSLGFGLSDSSSTLSFHPNLRSGIYYFILIIKENLTFYVPSEDVPSGPRVCLHFNWASSPAPSLKNDFYNHFHLEKIKYFLMALGGDLSLKRNR